MIKRVGTFSLIHRQIHDLFSNSNTGEFEQLLLACLSPQLIKVNLEESPQSVPLIKQRYLSFCFLQITTNYREPTKRYGGAEIPQVIYKSKKKKKGRGMGWVGGYFPGASSCSFCHQTNNRFPSRLNVYFSGISISVRGSQRPHLPPVRNKLGVYSRFRT